MSKTLAGVWAAIAAALILVFFLTLASDSSATSAYEDDLRQANARTRLYLSAEGRTLSEPSVERKLGSDVFVYVRNHGGQLDGFNANTNSYGGISDAIGEDPFNGVSCSECGPLKQEWENRFEALATGNAHADDFVEQPTEPSSRHGLVLTIFLLWLLVLPAFFVISAIVARQKRAAVTRKYSEEDRELLAALDRQLESGNADPELIDLKAALNEVLRDRATAGDTERTEMLINHLKGKARDRLEALEEGNRYL